MFVKIVRQGKQEGEEYTSESFFECERVHVGQVKNGLIFHMESGTVNTSVEVEHGCAEKEEMNSVYLMNNKGRTIDHYTLEPVGDWPSGTSPEAAMARV